MYTPFCQYKLWFYHFYHYISRVIISLKGARIEAELSLQYIKLSVRSRLNLRLTLFVFLFICSSPEGPHTNHMVYELYDADIISNALLRADVLTAVSLSFLVVVFLSDAERYQFMHVTASIKCQIII